MHFCAHFEYFAVVLVPIYLFVRFHYSWAVITESDQFTRMWFINVCFFVCNDEWRLDDVCRRTNVKTDVRLKLSQNV